MSAGSAEGAWRRYAALGLDLLFPPRCLGCGGTVDRIGVLCGPCWNAISFIAPPQCAVCGRPFAYDSGEGALCGACLRRVPDYARARAVFAYDEASKGLVLRFKHADRTHGAPAFAGWMARAGAQLLAEADAIVPVPLHWTRLFRRRFNQAALLAQELGRLSGVRVIPEGLKRIKRTPSQGHLGVAERQRNLAGAFRAPRRLDGRRVLLVDDVLTSGATAEACARALIKAGAGAVDVLTLARVEAPEPE